MSLLNDWLARDGTRRGAVARAACVWLRTHRERRGRMGSPRCHGWERRPTSGRRTRREEHVRRVYDLFFLLSFLERRANIRLRGRARVPAHTREETGGQPRLSVGWNTWTNGARLSFTLALQTARSLALPPSSRQREGGRGAATWAVRQRIDHIKSGRQSKQASARQRGIERVRESGLLW